jgi:hypothetical protein
VVTTIIVLFLISARHHVAHRTVYVCKRKFAWAKERELHEHILFTAKDVFLELGFERAIVDVISARADLVDAHAFREQGKLYLAVIELCAASIATSSRLRTIQRHGRSSGAFLRQVPELLL